MRTKREKQEPLSDHVYGDNHPYIGKPCLWRGMPAIPYGSYFLEADEHTPKAGVRLAILVFSEVSNENGVNHYSGLHGMSGVMPDDEEFVILNSKSVQGKRILHLVLSSVADFRRIQRGVVT